MKEYWQRLTGYCEECKAEMRPILEARCDRRVFYYGKDAGAVVQCRGCKERAFVWDTIA